MRSALRRVLGLVVACVSVALIVQQFIVGRPSARGALTTSQQEIGPGCTPTTCRRSPTTNAASLQMPITTAVEATATLYSCPTYSGPLFRRDNAQFVPVQGMPLLLPYDGQPQAPRGWLQPFPLSSVTLAEGSAQWRSMRVNLEYLLSLEPDMLLWSWRRNAGLSQPPAARQAGGWEAPDMELRGVCSIGTRTRALHPPRVSEGRERSILSCDYSTSLVTG